MKRCFVVGMIMILVLILTVCESVKGPTGPQGPKGETGQQGPTGPEGKTSVLAQTIIVSTWEYNSDLSAYTAAITDSNISQDILDHGFVVVYWEMGTGVWVQLPWTLYITSSLSTTYSVLYSLNTVLIMLRDSDLTKPNDPDPMKFKIVAVSGSTGLAKQSIDWSNYEEIKKEFQL
jgi:hypothetical protein